MNSVYREDIPGDITEEYACKCEYWMSAENDESVLDYFTLSNGNYIVKLQQDQVLKC